METVAVYEEHPIKAYTLKAEAGFALLSLECPLSQCGGLHTALAEATPEPQAVFCHTEIAEDTARMVMCLAEDQARRVCQCLAACPGAPALKPHPCLLIRLQGPHYGDRYGIAAAALKCLRGANLAPLALAGMVHTLFLALPEGAGEAALSALDQCFAAPGGENP